MVKIVIIEKNKSSKTSNVNKFSVDTLYKKCKLGSDNDFVKRTTWEWDGNTNVSVYAKDAGRAGSENKFDFPPPIDKELYYGNIALVAHNEDELTDDNIVDFTKEEWGVLYEKLLGGIEDLNDDEEYSSEEEVDPDDLTKQGYLKDGFVVSDEEQNKIINNSDEDSDYNEDVITSSSEGEDSVYKDEAGDEAGDEADGDDEAGDETDGNTTGEDSNSELSEEEYAYN